MTVGCGSYISPGSLKMAKFHRELGRPVRIPAEGPFSGHVSKAFQREASKKVWKTNTDSSGRMDIAPSQRLHRRTAALRAQADVEAPDSLQKLRHVHGTKAPLKPLPILKLKNNL